ncbi:MAG: class I SAM-dependent methyltransferase [Flavobacteriales bacterium]|nr:class I SAM-dependent methyltransferase [Flavobacteriales bacterium]
MAVERVDAVEQGSPWHEEHLSRYVFASKYFKSKRVLDIACGTGFGSEFILNNKPDFLYAADVSEEAIEATKRKIEGVANSEVGFQNGCNMSFEDNSFDVVISIETIEHIENDIQFLAEIHRVLKPDGVLIISTPNGLVTNPNQGKPVNQFHVREDFPKDLQRKLNTHFLIDLAAGQHVSKKFKVAPFLPSFSKHLMGSNEKVWAAIWSVIFRLPRVLRNSISNMLLGHDFYPQVEDYTFEPENIEKAHVQYYICRNKGIV